MKKILFILFVIALILLAGCKSDINNSNTNQQKTKECAQVIPPEQQQGCTITPVYNQDKTCIINFSEVCTPIQNKQPENKTEEFGVEAFNIEADDLGLYPGEIIVNHGNKVKITFKVRTDKVYYGGLDFRSDVFNTGKVLPGETKTVEFTADKSFEYKSYWPASERLKATGKVNVIIYSEYKGG